jgi:hypothetical protein
MIRNLMTQPDVRDPVTGYDTRGRCVDELRRYMNMGRNGKYTFGAILLQLGASYNMAAPARRMGIAEMVKNVVAAVELKDPSLEFDEKARLEEHEFMFVYCMADNARCVQAKDAITAGLKASGLVDFQVAARAIEPFEDLNSDSLVSELEKLALNG